MTNMKKVISVGSVLLGGNNPIRIQSMTNTKTRNIGETVTQIHSLEKLGCEIIRVAVENMLDAKAIRQIKDQINIPLVADIHFDYMLAIEAIKSGADKIIINPGNIGSLEKVKKIIEVAKEYNIPIRIGVNSGSIEPSLIKKYGGPSIEAMLESIENHIKFFEENNFTNLVLSIKTTNLYDSIKEKALRSAHRLLAFHKTGNRINADIVPAEEGYMVKCSITDKEKTILDLNIYLTDDKYADNMKENFVERAEVIYKGVLALLSGDVNYIFDD